MVRRIYMPLRPWPGGFGKISENDEEIHETLVFPAKVACLFFMRPFEILETDISAPGAPQGPFWTFGVRRNYANSPGVPQLYVGTLGLCLTCFAF